MTPLLEGMDIALRAWAVPDKRRKAGSGKKRRHKPEALVVFDTETELHGSQRLLVGAYRYVRVEWRGNRPVLSCAEEGLFVPDDLAERDPAQDAMIREYAEAGTSRRRPEPAGCQQDAAGTHPSRVLRADVVGSVLAQPATVVGFNLGFDLSRLSLSWHNGRGLYNGAFVFRLWEWEGRDHRFRPNLVARRLDNKRTLFAWTPVKGAPDDGDEHRSSDDHFLDLRTLLFAETNTAHSLESGSAVFGLGYSKREVTLGVVSVDLLDYVREDVAATSTLAGAALREFHRHPVPALGGPGLLVPRHRHRLLPAHRYPPPLERAEITDAQLAQSMGAFYGPRVEVRVRHVPVPVSLVDFASQYSNVARLSGLWSLLTSERIVAVDATDEVRELLERVELADVLDPELWPSARRRGPCPAATATCCPTRAWFAGRGRRPAGRPRPDRLRPAARRTRSPTSSPTRCSPARSRTSPLPGGSTGEGTSTEAPGRAPRGSGALRPVSPTTGGRPASTPGRRSATAPWRPA